MTSPPSGDSTRKDGQSCKYGMRSGKTAFKHGLQYISHAASALGCLVAAATPHAIPWQVKVEPWHVEVKLFYMLLHWTPSCSALRFALGPSAVRSGSALSACGGETTPSGSPLKFQVSAFRYSPVPHHRQPTGAQQAIGPENSGENIRQRQGRQSLLRDQVTPQNHSGSR